MTPVEERIDHEEAKRIAEAWAEWPLPLVASVDDLRLMGRAYLDLLTEHSARERQITGLIDNGERLRGLYTECSRLLVIAVSNIPQEVWRELDKSTRLALSGYPALPATEPAQPEEERLVDLPFDAEHVDAEFRMRREIHSESPPVEADQ